tara:strand:+ start:377 stop:1504 length:1128 start_codon:yes stop_codon:yes gene_type:complete
MNKNSSQRASAQGKIRVGIFFGGRSAEHDVSVRSAKNIIDALDRTKFTPVLIGIDQQGYWHSVDSPASLSDKVTQVVLSDAELTDSEHQELELLSFDFYKKALGNQRLDIDVAFPVLHGPYGEDGSIQGLFEVANIPYVGPGVLSSSINMDKDVSKRLLKAADIAVAPFLVVRPDRSIDFNAAANALGIPLFIKPANMGSSVGVYKVSNEEDFAKALDNALEYDTKVLIESAIIGEEIECSVLGNDSPEASAVGRIIPNSAEFYDYSAKYIDENGAVLEIPADIAPEIVEAARKTAIKAYRTLECEGMSRVDMFVTQDNEIVVNELNTIPGFTNISMYPKLWEASGLSYTDLITQLIELAIERHSRRSLLKTTPL